jgi:IS30 family transposase
MDRAAKIAKARELRAKGWTLQQIGLRFGVTHGAIWKWLNPEKTQEKWRRENADPKRKAAKRAHEKACRRNCDDCGDLLGAGSGYPGACERFCPTCWHLREAERVDKRARQIETWWADGWSLREIQDRLGWSKGHVAMEFHHLRALGYDLPYRRKHHKNPPRFPDQVAA